MADTSPKPDAQKTDTRDPGVGHETADPRSQRPGSVEGASGGIVTSSDVQSSSSSLGKEIAKYIVSILILGIGVAVLLFLRSLRTPPQEQESKELVPMVQTMPVVPYSGQLDKMISGTVVPFREIKVAAEVSGNVASKAEVFEAGNFVTKGTQLLQIDPTDYQLLLETGLAEVDQTEKMLDETKEEIAGAKRNVANAENEYHLAKNDHQRNLRIRSALSAAELDQSKRALQAAQTGLTSRKNSLDMMNAKLVRMKSTLGLAKSKLSRSELNLKRTVVVAPDDGVIVREMVQEGDYVRAGDPLVMFEDTSRSEVLCNLAPTDLAWIRDNSPANKSFEGESKKEAQSPYYLPKTDVSIFDIGDPSVIWRGVLERFDGIGLDESTRTIPVRITIREPVVESEQGQRALVRGMFVKCKIEIQTSTDNAKLSFLSFPAVALRPGNYVWVVEDRKLRKVDVKVVDFGEQLIDEKMTKIVVIASKPDSLKSGDEIVTTPIPQPREGKDVLLESDVEESELEEQNEEGDGEEGDGEEGETGETNNVESKIVESKAEQSDIEVEEIELAASGSQP